MNLNEAQAMLVSFDVGASRCEPILVHALGLAGEAGEVVEPIKKSFRDGKPLPRGHLMEELGDVFWYVCVLADDLGMTLSEIVENTRAKLELRRITNLANGIKDRRSA